MINNEEIIAEIVEGIIAFKIIPFFGAGMSKPLGAVDWDELIGELKSAMTSNEEDFLVVAQQYEKQYGRTALLDKIESLCKLKVVTNATLKNHLRILAMNPPIIYTTNYDEAVEYAANSLKRPYKKIVTLEDIVDAKHGERLIVKFHGDFSRRDRIIFTRNDYERRLNVVRDELDVLFRAHILGKSVLFLGYSFSDRNIDYIFKLHADYYGVNSLPKSYLITFTEDLIWEQELSKKNVTTIVLKSPDELESLLNDIGERVSERLVDKQFEEMMNSFVCTVLTDFELNDLKAVFQQDGHTAQFLADKLRSTIELREIPDDIEGNLADFIVGLLEDDHRDLAIKKAIGYSFQHTLYKKSENVFKVAVALMFITSNKECRFNLERFEMDVTMQIEMKLGDAFGAENSRKILASIILLYLDAMKNVGVKLEFDHLDCLLDRLKGCRYQEFGNLNVGGLTEEKIEQILRFYFSQHGQTLKARFDMQSFASRRTGTEIRDSMLRMMPLNRI